MNYEQVFSVRVRVRALTPLQQFQIIMHGIMRRLTLFFYQRNNDQNKMTNGTPLQREPRLFQGSWLLSWQQHFLHNNVFMTLVPAGGLLANMGGQDSLRQRQNTHSAIYLQEQKTRFLALIVFFFFQGGYSSLLVQSSSQFYKDSG